MEFTRTTRSIQITVRATYLDDRSDPDRNSWAWAYHVRITNNGPMTVQLLRRTWHIIDGRGRIQIVQGDGVVGQQPVFEPGETFEYTSGTPLETSSGVMEGAFHMIELPSREPFDAVVPPFSLDAPSAWKHVH